MLERVCGQAWDGRGDLRVEVKSLLVAIEDDMKDEFLPDVVVKLSLEWL